MRSMAWTGVPFGPRATLRNARQVLAPKLRVQVSQVRREHGVDLERRRRGLCAQVVHVAQARKRQLSDPGGAQ